MFRRALEHGRHAFRELSTAERLVLFAVAILHIVGIGWGLPSSDGWDVDGIAPRDFLPGVIKTFTPGEYFTYPPLHLALLTVVTLPVTIVALARSPSTNVSDVVRTFIEVPYMTSYALVARLVTFAMSVGLVVVLGRMAASIFGPRARPWAMAVAGVEAAGTYYAHTSNLDVPALFWTALALHALMRAVDSDRPRALRPVAVLAACAIATKDQAYAAFALSVPAVVVAWLLLRARESGKSAARAVAVEALALAAGTVALVLVLDGAVFNPTGFAARVRFLTGPASQDFAQFTRDASGRVAAVRAALAFLPHHHPLAVGALFVIGVGLAVARTRGRARVVALVPLFAIVSFTLAFNAVARRIEERFMLPQMQLLAVYAGGAVGALVDAALARRRPWLAWGVRLAGAAVLLAGLRMSAMVVANMLGDARYDASAS